MHATYCSLLKGHKYPCVPARVRNTRAERSVLRAACQGAYKF